MLLAHNIHMCKTPRHIKSVTLKEERGSYDHASHLKDPRNEGFFSYSGLPLVPTRLAGSTNHFRWQLHCCLTSARAAAYETQIQRGKTSCTVSQ